MQTSLTVALLLSVCGTVLADAPAEVKACTATVKAAEQLCVNTFNAQNTSPGKETDDQIQLRGCCAYWRFKKCSLNLFVANHNADCLAKLNNYFTAQEAAQQLSTSCAKYPAIDNPVCKAFQV